MTKNYVLKPIYNDENECINDTLLECWKRNLWLENMKVWMKRLIENDPNLKLCGENIL